MTRLELLEELFDLEVTTEMTDTMNATDPLGCDVDPEHKHAVYEGAWKGAILHLITLARTGRKDKA